MFWLLAILAYLLGSLSFAILLSRLTGNPDPRMSGSGNAGATNMLRLAGKKLAILTLIGDLCKGLLPVLIALPWMLWQKRWRELLIYGPVAIAVALVVSLPWALAVHAQEPDYWRFFFWHEHIRRFASDDAQHDAPWWFYLPLLVAFSLPWMALLPSALRQAWQTRRQTNIAFLLLWLLMPLQLALAWRFGHREE